ncbi:acyl carrier protein [Streptomyces sp. NPDC048254]|uniref:acyl carrier protein n=1 Tax=Streptomyces sp. NPDC048254 TaxID=3365525 RepID=UPI00371A41F6
MPKPEGPLTEKALHQWLVEYLAARLDVAPGTIDTRKTFESYGLDSRVAVQVSGALEKVVEHRLSPGLLYEYQSIDELSQYLARELRL